MNGIKNIVKKINLNYNIDNFIRMVNTSAHLLDIDDVTVYIMPMNKRLDDKYHAYIHQMSDNMFTIYIKEKTLKKNKINNFNIHMILHEMGHMKQYLEKRLVMIDGGRTAVWEHKKYGNDYPYHERPWEIEADNVAYEHKKELKKLLKLNAQ